MSKHTLHFSNVLWLVLVFRGRRPVFQRVQSLVCLLSGFLLSHNMGKKSQTSINSYSKMAVAFLKLLNFYFYHTWLLGASSFALVKAVRGITMSLTKNKQTNKQTPIEIFTFAVFGFGAGLILGLKVQSIFLRKVDTAQSNEMCQSRTKFGKYWNNASLFLILQCIDWP